MLPEYIYYNNIYATMFHDQEINYNVSKSSNNVNIDNLDNIHFLFLNFIDPTYFDTENTIIIPKIIECYVNGEKTTFRLEYAIIYYTWETKKTSGAHVISGFICKNEYYIYDQSFDAYFKIDWTTLDIKNFEPYINYLNLRSNSTEITYHHSFTSLPAIYCNTGIDFSYNRDQCNPERPPEKNKFQFI
ncbi:MAG: hypothetical protein Dasosvirus11_5 [Dasosvirus sp.]|uniref:Uncharacterized protein n=1 Tax=Dasosvirus sp. TaxID=2487764 RepID=A0A3G4ZTF4_9VIRU|nr:MAG: hypothetical protein Dasosvirus11_5 [Dasosvirus sp.]